MNKLLHLNSFFTKIILAVLSFAVIICIFIPYTQIPAVKPVHDVDIENKTFDIYIGKEVPTINIVSEFGKGQPYLIYKDAELTQTVERTSLPLPEATNTYYLALYAYGYDKTTKDKKLDYILTDVYTVTLNKDTYNNTPVSLTRNNADKTITVRVPNTSNFDFTRVINSKYAWAQYPNAIAGAITDRSPETDKKYEVTSLSLGAGDSRSYYIAISVKSEENPMSTEENAGSVYFPLTMYTLNVKRDAKRKTLPTVGEIGMGLLSIKPTAENNGVAALYTGDMIMYAFMILAAVSTLFALIIPNKFKFVELVIGCILGAALIAFPLVDYFMFFGNQGFYIEAGWIVLMVLGLLIAIMSVFDCYRCRSEYMAEYIRIYGEKEKKPKKEKKAKEEIIEATETNATEEA